jgi:hypothetical protein
VCCRYKEDEDEDERFFLLCCSFRVFVTLLSLFREKDNDRRRRYGERTLLRLRRVRGSVLLETLDFRLVVRTNLRRHGEELVALKVQQTSIRGEDGRKQRRRIERSEESEPSRPTWSETALHEIRETFDIER